MSVDVTSGRNRDVVGKVYDRLRKRSLRARGKQRFSVFVAPTRTADFMATAVWEGYDHAAYVAGVRDALNAISAAQRDA